MSVLMAGRPPLSFCRRAPSSMVLNGLSGARSEVDGYGTSVCCNLSLVISALTSISHDGNGNFVVSRVGTRLFDSTMVLITC